MNSPIQQDVANIAHQIVATYKPEKVILFGSAVRGEATQESDLDFLIVKETQQAYHDRVMHLRRGLQTTRALDLIILTPEEFQRALDERRVFVRHVLRYGKTLYDKSRIQ